MWNEDIFLKTFSFFSQSGISIKVWGWSSSKKTWYNKKQPFEHLRIGITIDIVIIFQKAVWVFASTCPLVFQRNLLHKCLETNLVKDLWFTSVLVHLLTFLWIFQKVEQLFCRESTVACFFKKGLHSRCYRRNFPSF